MDSRIITIDSEEANKVIVFLNGQPLRYWIAAKEGEKGWVEVLDTSKIRSLIKKEDELEEPAEDPEELQEFPTRMIEGRVEFKTK